MPAHKDIVGQIIGNWKILELDHIDKHHNYVYKCECQCEFKTIRYKTKQQIEQRTRCNKCSNLPKDLRGQIFGNLKVISLPYYKNDRIFYDCECQCKNKTILSKRSDLLLSQKRLHCGCKDKQNLYNPRIYRIWLGMLYRCSDKCKDRNRKNYYERGIRVCDEWNNKINGLKNFENWALNNGYKDDLTLDRINVNGNYEPDNCRWATAKEQGENKRDTIFADFFGDKIRPELLSKQYGIDIGTIKNRVKNGFKDFDLIKNIPTNNLSGVVGVARTPDNKKWRAYITVNKNRIDLGIFDIKEDAVVARMMAEEKYFTSDFVGNIVKTYRNKNMMEQ